MGLKLDHDNNEFLFNLDEKFQNYYASAVQMIHRDVVLLASQIFDTQGFVSPYVMQYKKLLPMLWHNNVTWAENQWQLSKILNIHKTKAVEYDSAL